VPVRYLTTTWDLTRPRLPRLVGRVITSRATRLGHRSFSKGSSLSLASSRAYAFPQKQTIPEDVTLREASTNAPSHSNLHPSLLIGKEVRSHGDLNRGSAQLGLLWFTEQPEISPNCRTNHSTGPYPNNTVVIVHYLTTFARWRRTVKIGDPVPCYWNLSHRVHQRHMYCFVLFSPKRKYWLRPFMY
jgi:hypothetical protein